MANTYTSFFDVFPRIPYDIKKAQSPEYEAVTNIFFRLAVIKEVLNNTSSYYNYDIDGDDTPEIVAEKVYGDSGAGWMIIYANEILDPQFDWVMSDQAFNKYLTDKYGSPEIAQTTVHHYEKVVETTVNGYTATATYTIDRNRLTENELTVPDYTFNDGLNYFTIDSDEYTVDSVLLTADLTLYSEELVSDIGALNEKVKKTYNTYEIGDQTVHELTYARIVSNYDYEAARNDSRRQIKVIKSAYYPQILNEFTKFVGAIPSYIRTVA